MIQVHVLYCKRSLLPSLPRKEQARPIHIGVWLSPALPDSAIRAVRGELRQKAFHDARPRRRENQVRPRLQAFPSVGKLNRHPPGGDILYYACADKTVYLARLERLTDFAVENLDNMLCARAANRRNAPINLFRLEKYSVHWRGRAIL